MPPRASEVSGSTVSGNSCAFRSSSVMSPLLTMKSSVRFHRASACSGSTAGSHREGEGMMPASSADSLRVSSVAGLPKYACDAASIPYAPRPK